VALPLTLCRWVHVVAASLWLGSLVFIIVVIRAPVQELGHETALETMLVRFRRRYKGLLIATVAALAVSGIAALAARHGRVNAPYVILLIVKILLSVGVVALFWYVAFVREQARRTPRPQLDEAEQPTVPTAESSEQMREDVDFLFRPKRQQAFLQWWIIVALLVVFLLGVVVAHIGTGLAEREERRQAPAGETPEGETPGGETPGGNAADETN
jgi:uncharacterized membrane protein